MKKMIAIAVCLFVGACASPTMKMSDPQIMSLSDDQICSYKNNYKEEPRLNAEMARRGMVPMDCNPRFRECARRGNRPGTEAMNFCMDMLRENERLRRERDWYDDRAFLYGHGGHRRMYSGVGVGLGF